MKKKLKFLLKPFIIPIAFSIGYIFTVFLNYTFIFEHGGFSSFKDSRAWVICIIGVAIICLGIYTLGLHRCAYSYVSVSDLTKMFIINILVFLANLILQITSIVNISFRECFNVSLAFFALSFGIMFSYRFYVAVKKYFKCKPLHRKKIMIVGAGMAGVAILREIISTTQSNYKMLGFIDDDEEKQKKLILGYKVLGTTNDIPEIVKNNSPDLLIIAMPSASLNDIKRISKICISTKCETKVLPGIYQLLNGQVSVSRLRDVDVTDLLGREPVKINLDEIMGYIENQVVLVTGGGGSIGSELCRQISKHSPKQLIILDIYENNAYDIEQELKRTKPSLNLVTLIASVRDSTRIENIFQKYKPDIVFHAAAHKHVPLMEFSPNEAVKNNIIGTYKVVKCADKYGVKKFVQISTDKAVNPTNIMGATKRVCEMIIQYYSKISKTSFVAVRFGNVLGSNGSVIPLFKKQIEAGGPVTVTHKDIIRYFMTIPEAVSLVLQAGAYAKGGEIFVLDMGEQVKIYDLAKNLIRLSGYTPNEDIEIKITGLRPGEKLYEERLMEEEGLVKTANEKISIGKPIDFDEEKLLSVIKRLYDEAYIESDGIKELVKELVPTYKVYSEKEESKK